MFVQKLGSNSLFSAAYILRQMMVTAGIVSYLQSFLSLIWAA